MPFNTRGCSSGLLAIPTAATPLSPIGETLSMRIRYVSFPFSAAP